MIIRPVIVALVAVVLAAMMFVSGWYVGTARLEKRLAQAQTKQLEKDAKSTLVIERKDDERKARVERAVEEVRVSEPEWSQRSLPSTVSDQLRNAGLYSGS